MTIVCIGETSEDQNDRGSDTISVDSKDMGENYWNVAELREKLREVMKDVAIKESTKLEEQLALEARQSNPKMLCQILTGIGLQEVMKEAPTWKQYLSTIKNRDVSGPFDQQHYDSFKKLDESIRGVSFKKGMPSGMITMLKTLHGMCEAASKLHLRQGWCDRNKIENQITTIDDFAKLLICDCEKAKSSSRGGNSKTDVVDEKNVAGPSREG